MMSNDSWIEYDNSSRPNNHHRAHHNQQHLQPQQQPQQQQQQQSAYAAFDASNQFKSLNGINIQGLNSLLNSNNLSNVYYDSSNSSYQQQNGDLNYQLARQQQSNINANLLNNSFLQVNGLSSLQPPYNTNNRQQYMNNHHPSNSHVRNNSANHHNSAGSIQSPAVIHHSHSLSGHSMSNQSPRQNYEFSPDSINDYRDLTADNEVHNSQFALSNSSSSLHQHARNNSSGSSSGFSNRLAATNTNFHHVRSGSNNSSLTSPSRRHNNSSQGVRIGDTSDFSNSRGISLPVVYSPRLNSDSSLNLNPLASEFSPEYNTNPPRSPQSQASASHNSHHHATNAAHPSHQHTHSLSTNSWSNLNVASHNNTHAYHNNNSSRPSTANTNHSTGSHIIPGIPYNLSHNSDILSCLPPASASALPNNNNNQAHQILPSPLPTLQDYQPNPPLDLPPQPLDPKEMDKEITKEKFDHAMYIYGFRVATCQLFLEGSCPNDAYTCFHAHSRIPRRRKPILQHGRFNYIPTRCRYIAEEKECPQSYHCRFAHVTEEVIYHPSKFKTQLCSHQVDKDGACSGYGQHCAKAHGPPDLRIPVFETSEDCPPPKYSLSEKGDFACAVDEQLVERLYYMYVYKTKKCEGFPYNCQCDGLDYHRDEERRRGAIIKYAPMACPNVKPYLNSEWGDPNLDCSGKYKPKYTKNGQVYPSKSDQWDCEYAHTLLELMYHPQVYKTGLCDHFDENDSTTWKCVWKRRCAHSHGKEDLRTKEAATEEWSQHLKQVIPPQFLNAALTRLLHPGGPAAAGREAQGVPLGPNATNIPPSLANQAAQAGIIGTNGQLILDAQALISSSNSLPTTTGNTGNITPINNSNTNPHITAAAVAAANKHSRSISQPVELLNVNGQQLANRSSPNLHHNNQYSQQQLKPPQLSNRIPSPNHLMIQPTAIAEANDGQVSPQSGSSQKGRAKLSGAVNNSTRNGHARSPSGHTYLYAGNQELWSPHTPNRNSANPNPAHRQRSGSIDGPGESLSSPSGSGSTSKSHSRPLSLFGISDASSSLWSAPVQPSANPATEKSVRTPSHAVSAPVGNSSLSREPNSNLESWETEQDLALRAKNSSSNSAANEEWRSKVKASLQCCMNPAHILVDAVSNTECCGVSLCRGCVENYLAKNNCLKCSLAISEQTKQSLAKQPSNPTINSILSLLNL
jgi:hypothetical protein